jgi:hypothetical protein
MKTVTESVVLPGTPEKYWRVVFDQEYLRKLYLEVLGFKDFAVLEISETVRKVRVVPKVNMPGPIAKLIGDRFTYEEHGTREANLWTWRMLAPGGQGTPNIVSTRGTNRIEAIDGQSIRRSDEIIVEGKVFGLGGLIEKSVEKEIHASSAKEYAFLKEQLQKA